MQDNYYGLILYGGDSSRMGKDKGLLTYHKEPQIFHIYTLLNRFCDKTFLSVKTTNEDISIPQIEDLYEKKSPLNGIISALNAHPDKNWIIVSCDMPFIEARTIECLKQQFDSNNFFTGYTDSDGNLPDPMLGIWSKKALPDLKKFIKKSGSPRIFIMKNKTRILQAEDQIWLTNVNTPEEFEKAKKSLP